MVGSKEVAQEISILMPIIARRILLDFFEKHNVPQTQIITIMALYDRDDPTRLTDLSREMSISAPTTTGIIDRLEKSDYAKRIPDQDDRRAINIKLTAKGERLAKTFRATLVSRWGKILNEISKEDRDNFLNILQKIKRVIQ